MSVTRVLRRRLRANRSIPRFEPYLPRPAQAAAGRPRVVHEIKHDGFRILAQYDAASVRLVKRNGFDFAEISPLERLYRLKGLMSA
jgi:ATP-dependent DNA ligase